MQLLRVGVAWKLIVAVQVLVKASTECLNRRYSGWQANGLSAVACNREIGLRPVDILDRRLIVSSGCLWRVKLLSHELVHKY